MSPDEIKKIFSELKKYPNEVLGQSFLVDASVLKKIADAVPLTSNTILEIGPGLGALTFLLPETTKLIAIEKDPALAGWLKEECERRGQQNITVMPGDILKQPSAWFSSLTPYIAVGNIPYYLTSRLIRTLLEEVPQPQEIIFTIQKEVAERMTAEAPDSNLLSVGVQVYGTPEILFVIPRTAFWPAPKVDSAVIRISRISKERFKGIDEKKFFAVLRRAFQGKRKLLTNTLGSMYPKDHVRAALETIGKAGLVRPEELRMTEWLDFLRLLEGGPRVE